MPTQRSWGRRSKVVPETRLVQASTPGRSRSDHAHRDHRSGDGGRRRRRHDQEAGRCGGFVAGRSGARDREQGWTARARALLREPDVGLADQRDDRLLRAGAGEARRVTHEEVLAPLHGARRRTLRWGCRTASTGQFDALVRWVEKGDAPDTLDAVRTDASGNVLRSRPLCPYPLVARYKGTGSTDDAANFRCSKHF